MKIENIELRRQFSAAPRCELCGQPNRHGLDPHHFYFKCGMGGGSRLDVALNLVALCRLCHTMAESGKRVAEIKALLLTIVAKRENVGEEELVETLTEMKWRPK